MNIGIHSDQPVTSKDISFIKDFFHSYDDIVAFSSAPHLCSDPNIAILPLFYMMFYKGTIIFTNEIQMKEIIAEIASDNIFLKINDTLTNIDKEMLCHELRQSK